MPDSSQPIWNLWQKAALSQKSLTWYGFNSLESNEEEQGRGNDVRSFGPALLYLLPSADKITRGVAARPRSQYHALKGKSAERKRRASGSSGTVKRLV